MPDSRPQLQIDEDIRQQQWVWRIERISWVMMLLIIIAAATGLLGHGWLSGRRAGSGDAGFVIDYQRFERHESKSEFRVRLLSDAIDSASTRIRFGQTFLADADITGVVPEPERIELDGTTVVYVFNTTTAGELLFRFTPTGLGSTELELGLAERPMQKLPIFVYP